MLVGNPDRGLGSIPIRGRRVFLTLLPVTGRRRTATGFYTEMPARIRENAVHQTLSIKLKP
jgi:hypothetical protein